MSIENKEPIKFEAPIYEVDISESWDPESGVEIFLDKIRELKFYRKGLLFSGFDGRNIGKKFYSNSGNNIVYCCHEENMTGSYTDNDDFEASEPQNAFEFAMEYSKPAIAIYDPSKMQTGSTDYEYLIKDSSALLAIIILK